MIRNYDGMWCTCCEPVIPQNTVINNKRLELVITIRLLRNKHLIYANINKILPCNEPYITLTRCNEHYPDNICVGFGYRAFSFIMFKICNDTERGPMDIAIFRICQICKKSATELTIDPELKNRLLSKI